MTPSEREVGYQQEPDDHRESVPLDMDEDGVAETVIAQDAAGAEVANATVNVFQPEDMAAYLERTKL